MVKSTKKQSAVALLSGGIDSPVAIHLIQDKLDIIAVHFHQLPLTDEKEVEKVKELAKKLGLKKVYLIPFANVLKMLVDKCNHRDYFILQKILMFQIALIVLSKESGNKKEGRFLITGENLAQVSSQTLSNLITIKSQVPVTILQPLLTFDKLEIIDIAKKIGTYEISKGPEICALLGPKFPRTSSDIEKIEKELSNLDMKEIIKISLNNSEILKL